ncbi:hypothetical protein AK812_SmicGene32528 [Symbiodinium microadriaticum]|uniref:Uncharacterized protein n=1 Tax=Symbiodinium microadriaticum TaxID=2951 RepID=A0A1Q9CTY8_SYMMI|nr:hypothetical protein AK812_SmicGene32528 [Symbiodinium microadriaticum]CAE7651572.1 unnamed protein product [Symbiodinium microadriaticum]CAE7933320.1 unnamed protein product [Symbiodinium sp. KB8]
MRLGPFIPRRGRRLCCALLLLAVLAPPNLTFGKPQSTQKESSRQELQVLGLHSADLFPVTNLSLLSWVTLIFCPRWRHLKAVALVGPIINAITYTFVILFTFSHPDPNVVSDITSLEGIVSLFRNSDAVFAGWLHYCVFDPLIGLGEVLDSRQTGVPHLFVVPCLLLTMFLGPMGFLLYLAARGLTMYVKDDGYTIQ